VACNVLDSPVLSSYCFAFSARQPICYSALYDIARPSVRPSVTRVDQSKTVEVRIMQLSPQVASSFLMVNFTEKFQR